MQISGGGHAGFRRGSCRFQEGVIQISGGGHADLSRGSCRSQEGIMQVSGGGHTGLAAVGGPKNTIQIAFSQGKMINFRGPQARKKQDFGG